MLDVENLPHEWQNIPKSIWAVFAVFMGKFFCLEKENGGEFIYEIYPRYLLSTVDTTVSRLC